jgi:eukaryotic-like serine/threonine-protein kinase
VQWVVPRPAVASVYEGMAIGVGARAGKYELVQQLGAGGFGLVYLARDHVLGRDCALKFLLPELTGDPEHVQRFLQEARAAARIQHPGIVTVFECGQFPATGSGVDGMVYIAMEPLRGESLATRLSRGALSVAGAVAITRQIASAVEAAHRIGVVHRDLKPENVYLVPDPETVSGERVKVLDFGIAKLGEASSGKVVQTAAYLVFGSPLYMSPEQCRSTARVDARADIYSLGVMLFEMLCGERPFSDPDMGALIAKHQLVEPPRLRTKVAGLPAALDELVASMLAKSPDARPQSMEAVQRALHPFRASTASDGAGSAAAALAAGAIVLTERVLSNPAISAASAPARSPADRPLPAPPTERLAAPRPRVRRWLLGGGLVAVAAVTAGVIATSRGGEHPEAPPLGAASTRLLTPRELRAGHRLMIERREAASLGAALASSVFAMGPDATEIAEGASAARALIGKHLARLPIGSGSAPIGHTDRVAWWIEIEDDRRFASSTIAVAAGHEWRVVAWKLAYLVPNDLAARLATEDRLPIPAAVVGAAGPALTSTGAIPAHVAFLEAMSSRAAFVAAFSTRGDAIATGTAPRELFVGGKQVRAVFGRLKGEFALRGAVASGPISDHAVWAAANVDYVRSGQATQIYRVLALMLKEGERWTIAMAHFSNAGPIGKS